MLLSGQMKKKSHTKLRFNNITRKIIAIGDFNSAFFDKEDFEIIDASNLHLTSGIIDEHSHIAISKGVNESSGAVFTEVQIGDVINPTDHNIYRQLAGGVVAAQLLHGSSQS